MTTALTPEQIQEHSDRYDYLSRMKLQQAQTGLDQGDTAQASEKIYGALANAVKACGELRGWNHYNHHRVSLILAQLAEENQAQDLVFAHMAASALHSNYFEHKQERSYVQTGIDGIKAAVNRLETIRCQPAPTPKTREELTPEQRRRLAQLNQPPDEPPMPVDQLPPVDKTN